jgi:hypothetical protein
VWSFVACVASSPLAHAQQQTGEILQQTAGVAMDRENVGRNMSGQQSNAQSPAGQAVPVLVELFTAEGCSTCPPADNLLAGMIASQPASGVFIVGLGEHVDYWDRLGWKDRFSSEAFTRRQQLYADRFKNESVYTPQMVVDGQTAFVGSDLEAARRAIERAAGLPHGVVRMEIDTSVRNRVAITVTPGNLRASPDDHADIVVALIEDGLQTEVKRGENKGRTLTHAAVVREMVTARAADDGGAARVVITIAQDWRRERMRAVVFVQERTSRRVLATASAPLGG